MARTCSPRKSNSLLLEHAGVADAAVVGVPDSEFGQRLKAYVVPAPGASPTADDLRAHVRDHLARHKVPREVELVDEIPRNTTGKVVRRLVAGPGLAAGRHWFLRCLTGVIGRRGGCSVKLFPSSAKP